MTTQPQGSDRYWYRGRLVSLVRVMGAGMRRVLVEDTGEKRTVSVRDLTPVQPAGVSEAQWARRQREDESLMPGGTPVGLSSLFPSRRK